MDKWPMVSLAELAASSPNSLATGPFGSSVSAKNFRSSGVPLIRGSNLSSDIGVRLLDDPIVYLDESKATEFHRSEARLGDLVFTCWGTIGQVGLIDSRAKYDRYIVSNKQMKLTPDTRRIDPLFLYYLLSSPAVVSVVQSIGIGSSVPGFNLGQLRSLVISLPPLQTQRAIAELLGALDDKIEANRRVELMVSRFTGSLLESQLSVAAETGTIVFEKLGAVARVNCRSVKPSTGNIQYLDIATVGDGERGAPQVIPWSSAPSRARRATRDGDTLWSTVRPNRRSHCLILDPPDELVVSTGFAVLTPEKIGPSLLYGLTERDEFVNYLVATADGSAYPAVRADRFAAALISLPPPDAQKEYEEVTMPLRRKAEAARRESGVLVRLRDALLPRLMSGELRVRDAEHLVEDAV